MYKRQDYTILTLNPTNVADLIVEPENPDGGGAPGADKDGDGLTDAIGLQDGMKIFFGANRPIEGEGYLAKADADVDVVPDTPGTGYHSWVTGWAGYRRDVYSSAQAREGIVIADFDSDGYDDVVTLSALAGDVYGSGLVYINPGDTLRLGGTFDIDAEGTIIEAESDEGAGIRQVTLGGDSNHDGVPDLWLSLIHISEPTRRS